MAIYSAQVFFIKHDYICAYCFPSLARDLMGYDSCLGLCLLKLKTLSNFLTFFSSIS